MGREEWLAKGLDRLNVIEELVVATELSSVVAWLYIVEELVDKIIDLLLGSVPMVAVDFDGVADTEVDAELEYEESEE